MEAALIYPHQLYAEHPAIAKERPVWLIEDPLLFGNDPQWPAMMHRQKLVLHRASMKAYAHRLEEAGHTVHYVDCPQGKKTDSVAVLQGALPNKIRKVHVVHLADDVLSRRLHRFAEENKIQLVVHASPNFLSPAEFLREHLAGETKPFMARFYEAQRKRMGILVRDDNSPVGGQWSFDVENRKKLPMSYQVPAEPSAPPNAYVSEAIAYVRERFPDNPGSLNHFRWAVTHEDADAWLERFIAERLTHFGPYEDAISVHHAFIHHSAITPALNVGLLDPAHVVQRVLDQATHLPQSALPSIEGFIRQVIGWREFMHGVYLHRGVPIRNGNFWKFRRRMPKAFYDATTGIPPVDRVIRQLLDEGWCHHIERLMLLGNFMLLCRIHPDDVYKWFMELFVDAYDWVMVPNVYGMSQFADGGSFTTKPYISGSNYIRKMSDEPDGPWTEIWNALFWSFIATHLEFFENQPRLSMMARTWLNLSSEKQEGHITTAKRYLATLK